MIRLDVSVLFLVMSALIAAGCAHSSSHHQVPESNTPVQTRLTEVIELRPQKLIFKPMRDDITVGCVMFSLYHSNLSKRINLGAIHVNGAEPKIPRLYLKQIGKNQFKLPALKIECSRTELEGPLYMTLKVWFNELTNQYDSPFHEHVPDRYAIVSYCTKENDDPSRINARMGANRVATLKEFKRTARKPVCH